ncbi:MAG: hypothetical protein ACK53L_09315, partial [Pirellulaceae bacterium]
LEKQPTPRLQRLLTSRRTQASEKIFATEVSLALNRRATAGGWAVVPKPEPPPEKIVYLGHDDLYRP